MDKSTIVAKLREHESELKAAGIEHLFLHGSYARRTGRPRGFGCGCHRRVRSILLSILRSPDRLIVSTTAKAQTVEVVEMGVRI